MIKQSNKKFSLIRQKTAVWFISGLAIILSFMGFTFSWLNPTIRSPLLPGLDFTGGTQIRMERSCVDNCSILDPTEISKALTDLSNSTEINNQIPDLSRSRIQFLDGYQSVSLRMPFLSASQAQNVIEYLKPVLGSIESGGLSVQTIGPTLGVQLLKSSLLSLLFAFTGIAIYISIRFDRRYAFLALLALAHDVIIVCGVFSWLGLLYHIEVDSLFAVALLTIAGYSVNDTVVVFDRIREINSIKVSEYNYLNVIDQAVSATLTRTLYTSSTTLLPLLALIFFGGSTLYWFAIALSLGVIVGSWSSIALAPTILSRFKSSYSYNESTKKTDDFNEENL